MEIGRIQQNNPNTNFMAKIKYNAVLKNLNDVLPSSVKYIGRPNDKVKFALSRASRTKVVTIDGEDKKGFTRILSVTADLFDGMKINWKCKIPFENKELDEYDCKRLSRIVQTYIRSITSESYKLKNQKAEILAKKPFAEFSIADPSGWAYISAISPYGIDRYESLIKAHFIAELANRAEKEINNGASVNGAIKIALNQLYKGKEYDMSEVDIKSTRDALDSVWKYGKKAQEAYFIPELANMAEKEIKNGASVERAMENALNQLNKSGKYYISKEDIQSTKHALFRYLKYGKNAQNSSTQTV